MARLTSKNFYTSVTLCSAGLEVLVSNGGMLPSGNTTAIPLNQELRMPLGHIGFLTPMNQQAKKRVAVLAVMTDPHHEGEIRLVVYTRDKEYTLSGIQEIP